MEGIPLTGKIDRIKIDKLSRTITIIDYKTGRPQPKWVNTPKLLKYKQQLYFYKILIESSRRFKGYTVATEPDSEFLIEPDVNTAKIHSLILPRNRTS